METVEQPLNKKQREELAGIVAFSTCAGRAVLFCVFVVLMGVVFRWAQHLLTGSMPLWLIPTVAVSVWLYRRSRRWTGGPELRQRIREDLGKGQVIVTIVEPIHIEEVEEAGDEGPSYIIETRSGEWILLSGQEMDVYKRRGFPWTKFGVIEAPQSKLFFGLKRMGDPIAVTRTRPPFTYEQAKALGCFRSTFSMLDETRRQLLEKQHQGT